MSEQHGTFPLEIEDGEDDLYSRTMVIETDTPTADRVGEAAPEPDQRLQTGSVLRDRYLLQERITNGSMGVVYKALDRHLTDAAGDESAVAIKVLTPRLSQNPNALRALQQEAAKGRCLTHPHIVRFIDLDREDSLYFLVMEWLEGRSLAEVLDDSSTGIDTRKSIDIVRQVGEALAYAHRRGVIHADVKPGNVMLLNDGSVKLIDFGIARVKQQQESAQIEESGILKAATPAYSSMQVLTGEEPTAADDVFSLACLAYRLIAGHRVFGPRNAAEAAQAGMDPQRPQGLSDSQWKALRKGLAYSRVTRQSSPMELVDELMRAGDAARPEAAPETPVAVRTAPPEVAEEMITARRDSNESVVHNESLAIPREAIIERRFDTKPARWPWWTLLALLLAVSGALVIRPDWREDAIARGTQLLEPLWEITGFASGTRPASAPAARPAPGATADKDDEAPARAETAATPETLPERNGSGIETGSDLPGATEPVPAGATTAEAATQRAATEADGDEPVAVAATPPEAAASPDPAASDAATRLVLAAPGETSPRLDLSMTEGEADLVVELNRWFGLSEALLVRIDEVGFSGNRSPGEAGEYRLSGDGIVSFDPGQRSESFSIAVGTDEEREPDRQVSLLLRDFYNAESVLARIEIRLLDDDQRSFETNFRQDAVAFVTGRVVVRERDPAVQIDVVRYNPSAEALEVGYTVRDLSATEGEDYFVPGRRTVSFGPGQRNARLLIPLVQDSQAEDDENFLIELDLSATGEDTIRRVAVIIRDDD